MPTIYEPAGDPVNAIVRKIINQSRPDLKSAGVTIGCLMAANPDGDAVKLHGYPCAAVVKKNSYKDRVEGKPDATITIDETWWEDANTEQRDALIDHELTHLELVLDKKTKAVKTDDINRPKLAMKLHDWQLGGFPSIAEKYGENAPEVECAKTFNEQFGQLVFGWAQNRKAVG